MAITSINAGTNPAAAIQKARADESEGVRKGASVAPQAAERARDAVEVAAERFSDAQEPRELAAARTALRHAGEMSEERRAELLDRIHSGFYSQPDVIDETAGRMADALKAKKSQ